MRAAFRNSNRRLVEVSSESGRAKSVRHFHRQAERRSDPAAYLDRERVGSIARHRVVRDSNIALYYGRCGKDLTMVHSDRHDNFPDRADLLFLEVSRGREREDNPKEHAQSERSSSIIVIEREVLRCEFQDNTKIFKE